LGIAAGAELAFHVPAKCRFETGMAAWKAAPR
jgi:hypothetical protein